MRQPDHFEDIVQDCLERLADGGSIEECVRAYPAYAAELVPILDAARRVGAWRIPPQRVASRNAVRERALFALETQRAMYAAPRSGFWHNAGRMAWRYAAALVVIFALFGTSVAAAQDDLPGDVLYNVKLGSEQVRVGLTQSPQVRADLLLGFAQRRVDECLALQAAQRSIDGSLLAIQNEYDRAWEAIGMVAPEERDQLIQRYQQNVQSQQAILTTALDAAPSGTSRSTLEGIIQNMRDAQTRIQNLPDASTPNATPAPAESVTASAVTSTADTATSATADVLGVTTTPTTTTLTDGTPLIRTPTSRTPTVGTARPGIITPTPGTRTPVATTRTPTPRGAPTRTRTTATAATTSTVAPSMIQLRPTTATATPPSEASSTLPVERIAAPVAADGTPVSARETATASSD